MSSGKRFSILTNNNALFGFFNNVRKKFFGTIFSGETIKMHSKKLRITRQWEKFQVQVAQAQFLRNSAYLQYAAMINPVKPASPSRLREFNRAGIAAKRRNWTYNEVSPISLPIGCHSRHKLAFYETVKNY